MSTITKDAEKNIGEVLGNLPDFSNERTVLQHTVESGWYILVLPPKFHLEVAGVGIEYSWEMSKLMYRWELNDEVPKHLHRNIAASMCPETILALSRSAAYHAARETTSIADNISSSRGQEEAESKENVERMRKTCKAHRNIIGMEPGFLDKQL